VVTERFIMRAVIVDDEPLARKLLGALLAEHENIEVVAECKNGKEAIKAIQDLTPDLLLLDIKMPGITGFDVIRSVQADLLPMVVFCTAYQRYALDAFDLHAVDYLLKPIDGKRLDRALQRAALRFHDEQASGNSKHALIGAIDEIAKRVSGRGEMRAASPEVQPPVTERKISVKEGDKVTLVDIDDIDWVDAAGDYMCIHENGVTHVLRSTIKDLMARLDPDKFKRIHRSTLVNLERVATVTSLSKGEYMLELDCDERLKVSRNYRDAIKNYLAQT
jgi:two-component system LytT family response regulator